MYHMVKICIFTLNLYRHARVASEKNETHLISLLSFMCTNTALAQIPTVIPLLIILYFWNSKCKLFGYFHREDPFVCSLHSPCHLFPLFSFCYTKHNLITFYSTGFTDYSIMPFHSSVLIASYAHHSSLHLSFPARNSMLCLSHDNSKLTFCKSK